MQKHQLVHKKGEKRREPNRESKKETKRVFAVESFSKKDQKQGCKRQQK